MGINKYEDIMDLPRPVSQRRGRMSLRDRGAQFSPFAALTGYEAVIKETARLTDALTELDESRKELLNRKLLRILDDPEQTGEVTFVCFRADGRKDGGSYVPITGTVKKAGPYFRSIIMEDGREFSIESIREIIGADEEYDGTEG